MHIVQLILLQKKEEEEENSISRRETRNHEKEILIRDYKTVYPMLMIQASYVEWVIVYWSSG